MHPRLTVTSRIFFERPVSLERDIADFVRGGARRIGLNRKALAEGGVAAGLEALRRAGIEVTHISHGSLVPPEPVPLETARTEMRESVDLAVTFGASTLYGPSGGRGLLEWDEAARRVAAGIEPVAEYARSRGIGVLIEPTISLFADISMLHTLRDTVELAEWAGAGICIDVQHCWTDRHLRDAIGKAGPITGLVQLSDWVPGVKRHFRAVPGDGAIPLERIVGWILEAGYSGFFDLELSPEEGVPEGETIARAIDRAGALLDRVGA